jgi:DNA mismatch repair protein MutS
MASDPELTLVEFYLKELELFDEKYGAQSIILMQNGDFYEIYGTIKPKPRGKAQIAKDILCMNMARVTTRKPYTVDSPLLFVGFPKYALEEHLGKFLRANFIIGIYDQFITGTNKGGKHLFTRKLVHVYSPSTFIDDTISESNNLFIFDFTEYKSPITKQIMKKVHIVILELSTGNVFIAEVYDTQNDSGKAESELYRILHSTCPTEIICCSKEPSKESFLHSFDKKYDIGNKKIYYKPIPENYKKENYQSEFLKKIYKIDDTVLFDPIEYLGLNHYSGIIPCFIQGLQFAFEHDKLIVSRIQKPRVISGTDKLILDNDSIYQLNLISSPGEPGVSLYDILCKAKTSMGKRCLRERLLNPITNPEILNKRYTLVEKMTKSKKGSETLLYEEYFDLLSGIIDIEKVYRKMVQKKLNPYSLADFINSLEPIKNILELAKKHYSISNETIEKFDCLYNELNGYFDLEIMKTCKLTQIKGNFFIEGVNEELDSINTEINTLKKVLIGIANKMSEYIEAGAVKIEQTEKEGWYLVTTKKRFNILKASNFSIDFTFSGKKYTIDNTNLEIVNLTNTVKIRSEHLRKVSLHICKLQQDFSSKILNEYLKSLDHIVKTYNSILLTVSEIISEIDVTCSAAICAVEYGYTKPIINDSQNGMSYLNISEIRHPIVERINDNEEFVTNNVSIGIDNHYGTVIYGLNMSGKSCLLKSIGCNLVMAQAGMFTACDEFQYFPFKTCMSKMTIKDNLSKGQSTFFVEMIQVKNVLTRADQHTLVLSDELCSSTESTSGHAIVAETLHELSNRKAKFLFSTHLHDLQEIPIIKNDNNIEIYHFKVHVTDSKIIFDRKLEKGGMSELYGLEVAKALGLPMEFMKGAFEIRDYLSKKSSEILSTKTSKYNKNVIVDACKKCGSIENLHTHHINEQFKADPKTGLINNKFHKNAKFNLEILCEKCHQKEHGPIL